MMDAQAECGVGLPASDRVLIIFKLIMAWVALNKAI